MQVTLIRHAEVDEAYHGCYNGHIDIGLSKKGENQSRALAQEFAISEFDALFCSDLLRAKMTIKEFVHPKSTSSLTLTAHAKQIIYTKQLREKSWGKHEGLSFDEIIAQGEVEYQDFLQWIRALDGEPYEEFVKRVETFFFLFLPSLKKESILVVTHAGVIRVLMSLVENISLEEAFSIKVKNASSFVFDFEKQAVHKGNLSIM